MLFIVHSCLQSPLIDMFLADSLSFIAGDRDLMISLVHDAKVTSWWNDTQNIKEDKG